MWRTCALIAAILLPAYAAAGAPEGTSPVAQASHWSMATGETVSPDRDAIAFAAGWPGASFTYLHGTSDRSDVGLKVDLLYEFENTSNSAFGAGFDVPFRLVVNRSEKVSLLLQVEPGLRLYSQNSQTDFMTRFPVGGVLGIEATPVLRLGAFAGLTMAVNWTHTQFFEIGPQFGLAAEYAADRNLVVGLDAKFGPQFDTATSGSVFAFTAQILVGYRM